MHFHNNTMLIVVEKSTFQSHKAYLFFWKHKDHTRNYSINTLKHITPKTTLLSPIFKTRAQHLHTKQKNKKLN